jgi:DNA-binding CsgD family transcriptional regulator
VARPRLEIDERQVLELARIQCTYEEMAAVLGCSTKTLQRHYVHLIEKGRLEGKSSLRRSQFTAAHNGSAVLLVWLGKQHLGQTDKITTTVKTRDRPRLNIPDADTRPGTGTGTDPGTGPGPDHPG